MSDGTRLVQAMQKMSQQKQGEIVDIVIGTVTSISPLKIKVDKIELTESFLILGALCIEKKLTDIQASIIGHSHTLSTHDTEVNAVTPPDEHLHSIPSQTTSTNNSTISFDDIILWRGLIVGDAVYMLKCGKGQKYFVLQRKEGLTA